MPDVKVTVLMPAWNAEKYISEAIRSVLDQSFTDFELLIIDDGSTDHTVAEINKFNDSRIRLIEMKHLGIAKALNNGLREAKGIYIARFDADDICLPSRLEKQVGFLENSPEYILTGSDAEYISENGEHLFDFYCHGYTSEEIIKRLYVSCPFIHSSVLYRKAEVLGVGGYPEAAHNFEDHLLWRQLIKSGSYRNIPEQLIKVRFNPNSSTIDEKWRGRRFRQLKRRIIHRGYVTEEESRKLSLIIKNQEMERIKKSAYHALCGKKFLINNHHPVKARMQLAKAIQYYPLRFDNYILYLLSFFPAQFIHWLHHKIPGRKIK